MQKNSIAGARLGSEYAFARCAEKKMDPSVLKIGLVDIYLSRRYLQTEICQEPTLRIQLILCAKYVKA